MFLKIAWRNLWRNPRRSGLVVGSIAVGLWGLIASLGFMDGMGRQMVENVIKTQLGHLQIHDRKYEARIKGIASLTSFQLDRSIKNPDKVERALNSTDRIVAWSRRIQTTGLATNAQKAGGVAIVGINPSGEKKITSIASSIVEGDYLEEGDFGKILLGKALAERLGVRTGSKVVLMAQDVHHNKTMAAFRVAGIYRTVSHDFEKTFVFMTLSSMREMLDMPGQVLEYVVRVDDPGENLWRVREALASALGEKDYKIMTWKEIFPLLVQLVTMFNTFTYIFFILVFIAMAFGIANAVLMAVFERIRELGIMKALGARPGQVFLLVAFESLSLGIVGVVTGALIGWATVAYFGRAGLDLAMFAAALDQMGLGSVIYTVMEPSYVVWGGLMALVTAFLSSLWPAAKAARLQPVEAIRHM